MELKRFDQMDLSSEMLSTLRKKGFEEATPVQVQTIGPMLDWQDIIAKAPTGTGKTFAFGIPIIEHIDAADPRVQALILAPTRELTLQICAELRGLAEGHHNVRVLSIYGGQPMNTQLQALKRHPNILVATPGRLIDHLNRRTVRLEGVQTAVLDEADRMLDMGFYKDVTRILDLVPGRKNLALLSATISREVMTIGWSYQRDAIEVVVPDDVENKPDILQYSLKIPENQKTDAITRIMKAEAYEYAIVFCNTKYRVERVTDDLYARGYCVDCIHGDIGQKQREQVMAAFRSGSLRILVATDVAARGIDIDHVDAVFNYDIPNENEYYIHRIGRTGRAKKHGTSYIFWANIMDDIRLSEIARYTRSEILPISIEQGTISGR